MHMNSCSYTQSSYKVVELSTVTDETIEEALNLWTSRGWVFDQIQFVVRDSSRRPSMAFMLFTRPFISGESEDAPDTQTNNTKHSKLSELHQGDINEVNIS